MGGTVTVCVCAINFKKLCFGKLRPSWSSLGYLSKSQGQRGSCHEVRHALCWDHLLSFSPFLSDKLTARISHVVMLSFRKMFMIFVEILGGEGVGALGGDF